MLDISLNNKDYEILTPDGFKPFDGIGYSGTVNTLRVSVNNNHISVSHNHKFIGQDGVIIANELQVGDLIQTEKGFKPVDNVISEVGEKKVYDILEVQDGNVYIANGIVNHNCQFVVDDTLQIISEWDSEKFVFEVEKDEFYKYYHKYVAMDLGFKDLTALLFGYYDFKKASLIIEDEETISGPKMTSDVLSQLVFDKEEDLWQYQKPYRRISDNNELILINDMSVTHSCHFIPTNKDELAAMINEVRLFVKSGRIIIHPRCEMLKGCLEFGIWKDSKDKYHKMFGRSKKYGHYDHLAALVYLVRNLDLYTNPVPLDYGISIETHHINPDIYEQHSNAADEFKKLFGVKRRNTKLDSYTGRKK